MCSKMGKWAPKNLQKNMKTKQVGQIGKKKRHIGAILGKQTRGKATNRQGKRLIEVKLKQI